MLEHTLHQRVAQLARELGLLSVDELTHALLEIQRISEVEGRIPSVEVWVDRGWLAQATLNVLLDRENRPSTDEHRVINSANNDALFAFVHAETVVRDHDALVLSDELHDTLDAEPESIEFDTLSSVDIDAPTIALELSEISDHDLAEGFLNSATQTLMTMPEGMRARLDTGNFERMKTRTATKPLPASLKTEDEGNRARVSFQGPLEMMAAQASPHVLETTLSEYSEQILDLRASGPAGESRMFKERYVLGEMLGRGGGGQVIRAYDRVLGRHVAMKILLTEGSERAQLLKRFIAEAQTTGQLEHPNIVPIYEFGLLPSGELFYTMREVRNNSLRGVLRSMHAGDETALEEYSFSRLVGILRQVCLAVEFAHARGVIHRDIKPDNIMLGDYGEVLVMDWGLARVYEAIGMMGTREMHEAGQTLGTPAYMPPEQARGELHEVDECSDVYSLGAILYEILTLEPPFSGHNPIDVMWNVVEAKLLWPRQRTPQRAIPDELERICMRAMSPQKQDRFASAKELHDALKDWSEDIQSREAGQRITQAEMWSQRYGDLREEIQSLDVRVRAREVEIESWASIDEKKGLWRLQDRLERAENERAQAFGLAVTSYTQALAFEPNNTTAKRGLVDLYWSRFLQAEDEGNDTSAVYFRALVRQYDEENRYAALLNERVGMRIFTEPEGARVTLYDWREFERRLEPHNPRDVGISPLKLSDLTVGSYLLEISHEDSQVVCQPVHLQRGRDTNVHVHLPPAGDHHPDFIFIPGGEFSRGGDPEAFDPRPAEKVFVSGFFCSKFPVTFAQYLEWINALHRVDPDEALARAPQVRASDGLLVYFDERQGIWRPHEILIEGTLRELYPIGEGHEDNLPVVGVSLDDAMAYAQWRGARDGVAYRLPTEDELEKAGRGVDGRLFSWGDRFDATFCRMRFTRKDLAQLEPVGTFPTDISPYGVRDLTGGVQEWCAQPEEGVVVCPVKGGSWSQDERACRLASRICVMSTARTASIGFRLVYDPIFWLDTLEAEQAIPNE